MTARAAVLGLVVILAGGVASADQQAYVSRSAAEEAARVARPGSRLRLFCAPCGDATWEEVTVASAVAAPTGYESYWELVVNGNGIDLAYAYVEEGGRWENLAMVLGLEAVDVPRFIGGPPPSPADRRREAAAAAATAGDALAAAVAALNARLDPSGRRLLADAQAAWLASRTPTARLAAHLAAGDDDAAVAYDLAVARLTEARSRELATLASPAPGGE